MRDDHLVAFSCLGAKRSGDIHMASALALIASIAERCADLVARIDAETLAQRAQGLYVIDAPGRRHGWKVVHGSRTGAPNDATDVGSGSRKKLRCVESGTSTTGVDS